MSSHPSIHSINPSTVTLDQTTSSISPLMIQTCANCSTQTTPLWRRDESGATLCNACALFQKMKGRPRPISLKTDIIKQRNRIRAIDRDSIHHSHSKSKSHRNIKLIQHHHPSIQSTPHQNQSSSSDHSKIKSSSISSNKAYSDETDSSFHSALTDSIQEHQINRPSIHSRKDESDSNHQTILYHSIGSKRRKEILQTQPISIPERILNGKPIKSNRFQSILLQEDQEHHSINSTSIPSHRLNNFESNQSHKNHPRNSLGSTSDFRFIQQQQQQPSSKSNDQNEVINHLQVPNLNRLSIHSNLNLSPITSPLGRSISVDPNSNNQTPISCSSSTSSSSNERGRPRTRLPPLSQLVSRTFDETQSPSRLSGSPHPFEENARNLTFHSPQPNHTRVLSSTSSHGLSSYSLNYHQLVSKRTSSVSSSKSSDNESFHSIHQPNPSILKPFTPPSSEEDSHHLDQRKHVSERDEELNQLKLRVNQLELINKMMKSKLTELESNHVKSWDPNRNSTDHSFKNSLDSSCCSYSTIENDHPIETSW